MKKLGLFLSIVFCFLLISPSTFAKKNKAAPPPQESVVSDDLVQQVSRILQSAAGCEDTANLGNMLGDQKARRPWCELTKIAQASLSLPITMQSYLGFTIHIPWNLFENPSKSANPPKPVDAAMMNVDFSNAMSVLYLGPSAARVTWLDASSEQEEKERACLQWQLTNLMNGDGKLSELESSKDLMAFLKTQSQMAGHPLKVEPNQVSYLSKYKLPSRVFLLNNLPYGQAYVVLEKADDGMIVNLFPVENIKVVKNPLKVCKELFKKKKPEKQKNWK